MFRFNFKRNVWFYHLEDMLHFRYSPNNLVIPCFILFTVRVSGLDPWRTRHSRLLQNPAWMISRAGSVVVVVSRPKCGVLTNTIEVCIVFHTELIKLSAKSVKISSNFLRTGYYFLSQELLLRLRQEHEYTQLSLFFWLEQLILLFYIRRK